MALKGRSGRRAVEGIKKLQKGVKPEPLNKDDNASHKKQRRTPLPESANVVEETQAHLGDVRKTKDFKTITIHGSKGEKYTVVVPSSYVSNVPKVWEWTAERYKVAELIAEGVPLAQIPEHPGVSIKSRMTIYCWLEHPEFKNHVDGLVMETGWANRRERLAKLERLNETLFNKVVNELSNVKLTDKMAGALLTAIGANAKLIAQEKGEFIEETKVTQDTTINGTMGVATVNIEEFMKGKTEDERKELEKEFDEMGDDVIRALTGNK